MVPGKGLSEIQSRLRLADMPIGSTAPLATGALAEMGPASSSVVSVAAPPTRRVAEDHRNRRDRRQRIALVIVRPEYLHGTAPHTASRKACLAEVRPPSRNGGERLFSAAG